ASTATHARSQTASGSRTTSTKTKRNYDSQNRRGLRCQDTATCIEQHIADPRSLHDVSLHLPPGLSNAAADFLHCLGDFRMVGLAGVAQALGEIVWSDAVQVDARYREDRIQIVE